MLGSVIPKTRRDPKDTLGGEKHENVCYSTTHVRWIDGSHSLRSDVLAIQELQGGGDSGAQDIEYSNSPENVEARARGGRGGSAAFRLELVVDRRERVPPGQLGSTTRRMAIS